MIARHLIAAGAVILLLVGIVPPKPASADEIAPRAEAFITRLADDAISKLTDNKVSADEQETRFREIMREYVAFQTIARWVLGGRYWRAANDAQRERYLSLFEQLMVATYAHRFQNYSGETLEVDSVQKIDDAQALVRTTLMRPNADKPLRVDWRVRATEDKIKVIDIMVEGLSMAQTQRSEFSSVLRANGGDVDALMADLETRLQAARKERIAINQEAAKKP
ncbi:MAG: ABC transporter substrate-binding protein [Rhodospirillales bacterium]|nr:ABC transporter substrate-binding protein [Rhodospirillales bacterium]MBO6788802.1 ABC transporter substrate-binding protein [Rhodospirillales bacterium]